MVYPGHFSSKGDFMAESFQISSLAFQHQDPINPRYTCEGEDISPALQWRNTPQGTKSLALIAEDPDAPNPKAPKTIWVHWVLYNISPAITSLPEGLKALSTGVKVGINGWKRAQYNGPCPPVGRHRYFFNLYALDRLLPDLHQPTKQQLEKAMEGHILAQATLMGTYQKQALEIHSTN
jgi:Raf kinase inhibitor-like YbhB/YbcL family protein